MAIGEVIELAWEGFKKNWLVLIGSLFVVGLIAGGISYVPVLFLMPSPKDLQGGDMSGIFLAEGVFFVLFLALFSFFFGGLIRIWLAIVRGQNADFGMLFSGVNRFLPLLAAQFILMILVMLGELVFIVPGVILALGLHFTAFYVVDADMGPIEAMKASWEATKGHKLNLFLFQLACAGLGIVGSLACCIGQFVSAPVCLLAASVIYVRLSGRGTALPSNMTAPAYP